MRDPIRLGEDVVRAIDACSDRIGQAVAWLVFAMALLVCYDVAMRYVFQAGSVALQELEWHLFALVFLLGAAYTFKHDAHVRVDVFYQSSRLGPRGRALVNVLGGLLLLLPFCALVIWTSWDFVAASYRTGEGSPDAGGLPYRFVLKAAIPAGFALLALQGLADVLRNVLQLIRTEAEGKETKR